MTGVRIIATIAEDRGRGGLRERWRRMSIDARREALERMERKFGEAEGVKRADVEKELKKV